MSLLPRRCIHPLTGRPVCAQWHWVPRRQCLSGCRHNEGPSALGARRSAARRSHGVESSSLNPRAHKTHRRRTTHNRTHTLSDEACSMQRSLALAWRLAPVTCRLSACCMLPIPNSQRELRACDHDMLDSALRGRAASLRLSTSPQSPERRAAHASRPHASPLSALRRCLLCDDGNEPIIEARGTR